MKTASPNQPNGTSEGFWGVSFTLALIAHGLLFCLLFVAIQWKAQPLGPVYAELWSPDAMQESGEAQPSEEQAEQETPPEPEPEPEPEPAPAPEPEPAPPPPPIVPPIARTDLDNQANLLEDPDIVQERLDREVKKQEEEKQRILEREKQLEEARRAEEQRKVEEQKQAELRRQQEEKRRLEEQKRLEQQKLEEQKRLEQERIEREKKEAEERKLAEEKRKQEIARQQEELKRQAQEREKRIAEEKAKREAQLAEKRRQQEELSRQHAEAEAQQKRRAALLNRLSGQSGSAMGQGSGMTSFQKAQYENRIRSCIRPHITYNPPAGARRGQYVARFEVSLLKNGRQTGQPKMMQSSRLTAYDRAVEKAILSCNPFPKPSVGDIPSTIILNFDPVDDTSR